MAEFSGILIEYDARVHSGASEGLGRSRKVLKSSFRAGHAQQAVAGTGNSRLALFRSDFKDASSSIPSPDQVGITCLSLLSSHTCLPHLLWCRKRLALSEADTNCLSYTSLQSEGVH